LDVVTEWLSQVAEKGQSVIPVTFNFDVFFKGLNILLGSEHYGINSETIFLLYNYYHLFHGPARLQLVNCLLLDRFFLKYFLHWNFNLNSTFIYLLIFKIRHFALAEKDQEVLAKINFQVSFVENQLSGIDNVQQKKDDLKNHHSKQLSETKIYDSSDIDPSLPSPDFVKHLEVYARQSLKSYQESLEEYEVWKQSPIDKETKTLQFPNPRLKFYSKVHG